jgi:uncharacterized lipoprotein YddW (UPF0748 family)
MFPSLGETDMAIASLVLLLVLSTSANEQMIDPFDYPDTPAAQRVWRASEGSPSATVAQDSGRTVVELPAPFASNSELSRVVLDRSAKLDLSTFGAFALEICSSDPQAAGEVTLYFHSGGGWYGAGASLAKPGWQKLLFSKAMFRTEDTPAGWDKIDGIRIAVWRGMAKDGTIRLRRLSAQWHDVAVVIPAAGDKATDGERRSALDAAGLVGEMLTDLGLGYDAIDETAVAQGALAGRRVAILAYNPRITSDAVKALAQFVAKGGKLLACYHLPEPLAQPLGFRMGKYTRQERPGQFAEIRLEGDITGLPTTVGQNSWNITTAEPAGHNARVIGQWYDDRGQSTGQPALLMSDNGAFLTHIFLPDHRAAKMQLLAAVLGRLVPSLWGQMAQNRLESLGLIGHLDSLDQLKEYVQSQKNPTAAERLAAGVAAMQTAQQQIADKAYPQAIESARQAGNLLREAYLRSEPSKPVEGRAWWNHSGTGAYPGDWDRTCKELSEAGFNMIVPNMLWAGLAHYPSEILPQSSTYRQYGDQIAQCVAAAKKYGIEVHVWKVNHYLSNAPKEFVERLRREGRTQVSVRGEPENWLCPSHPENFKLELESMLEVARKYDVDGLHFDYIRYPGRRHCYCDGCRERFEAAAGVKVENWPEDCYSGPLEEKYHQWRCDQITRLVEAVSREAKKIRPSIKISAAVFSNYPACRELIGQDWVHWVRSGYLDFVCPMDYTISDQAFQGLVASQMKLIEGRIPLYPGIGCTSSNSTLPPDRVVSQIHHARALGAAGFTIFNLAPDTMKTVVPAVGIGAGSQKAVPPHAKK